VGGGGILQVMRHSYVSIVHEIGGRVKRGQTEGASAHGWLAQAGASPAHCSCFWTRQDRK
jgi:hypothetical protein